VAPISLLYPRVLNGWFSHPTIPRPNLHPFNQVFLQLRMCFPGCIEYRAPPSSTTTEERLSLRSSPDDCARRADHLGGVALPEPEKPPSAMP